MESESESEGEGEDGSPIEVSDGRVPRMPVRRLKRGRRRANVGGDEGKRTYTTTITHTPAEYVRVKAMAAAMGVTKPRLYERALVTGDAGAAAELAHIALQLQSARRGVGGALVNLNQIAKVANTTGEVDFDYLQRTVSDLREQYDHLNEVLSRLPHGGAL